MPETHVVAVAPAPEIWLVNTPDGQQKRATIVSRDAKGAMFHFERTDKRMDLWVPWQDATRLGAPTRAQGSDGSDEDEEDEYGGEGAAGLALALNSSFAAAQAQEDAMDEDVDPAPETSTRKRRRRSAAPSNAPARRRPTSTLPVSGREVRDLGIVPDANAVNGVEGGQAGGERVQEVVLTEAEYDLKHHEQIYAQRNFDKVYFGEWEVKTWYFSPYPLTDIEEEELAEKPTPQHRIPGIQKSTTRAHGRTLDLYIGGLQRFHTGPEKPSLWVCEHCFKYYANPRPYELHIRKCNVHYPPGGKVYHKGDLTIWEIDGAKSKLYCQNLALFGKLFIDVKTLFFDCDNFLFYVLCNGTTKRDTMLGFFSKEKKSFDDYNLACIMTLPPHQRNGYGRLMIEFSYELCRRAGKVGTPERPLSDLGLRSYLSYWVATLLMFFRHTLSVLPPDTTSATVTGTFPALTLVSSHESSPDAAEGKESESQTTNGNSNGHSHSPSSVSGSVPPVSKRTKKKIKGYAGEVADGEPERYIILDPQFSTQKTYETTSNPDGSASTHVAIHCTLEDIARATNLRPDDAAFAMNEVGLLMQRLGDIDDGGQILITRERVERIAQELKVKWPILSQKYILLDKGQYTLFES